METITLQNLETGHTKVEIWQPVKVQNINPCFLSPDGRYYTKGLIGFYDVTNLVKL